MKNSSEAQKNDVKTDSQLTKNSELVRIGQRLFIFSFLGLLIVGFVIAMIGVRSEIIVFLIQLVAWIVILIGFFCIGKGFGYSTVMSVLLCTCWLIPGVNLIVFFYLLLKSTKVLKAAGYSVGLLGAKKFAVA